MKGTLNENEARYIVRMIFARQENCLFIDATYEDDKELDVIEDRYDTAGRWEGGRETSLAEFILRVVENGVPGGRYIHDDLVDGYDLEFGLEQRGIPRIERPKEAGN